MGSTGASTAGQQQTGEVASYLHGRWQAFRQHQREGEAVAAGGHPPAEGRQLHLV